MLDRPEVARTTTTKEQRSLDPVPTQQTEVSGTTRGRQLLSVFQLLMWLTMTYTGTAMMTTTDSLIHDDTEGC